MPASFLSWPAPAPYLHPFFNFVDSTLPLMEVTVIHPAAGHPPPLKKGGSKLWNQNWLTPVITRKTKIYSFIVLFG